MKIRFTKKVQLVEALEAKRALCEQRDAEAVAKHKVAEREFLASFKEACRTAVKWDYAQAKSQGFSLPDFRSHNRPECPARLVDTLNEVLHHLAMTHQEAFTIDADSYSYTFDAKVARILRLDAPAVKSVC